MCSIIHIKYINSSNTSTAFCKVSTASGYFEKFVDVFDECIYFMLY